MEDNSYVSLSLEKYNELYDKAKAYDEMQAEEVTNGIWDLLKGRTVNINSTNNEETAATTEEVAEEVDDEIAATTEEVKTINGLKVGDKVKGNSDKRYAITNTSWIGYVLSIKDEYNITVSENMDNDSEFKVEAIYFEKINESEEK